MKLSRGKFWLGIAIVWAVEFCVALVGRGISEEMSPMRIFLILLTFVVYLALIVFRLNDAGKSKALLLVCFIIPIFMFYIGALESEYSSQNVTE